MTQVLGKKELLSGELLRRELVEIPDKGKAIWMRQMTGAHVIEFKRIIEGYQKDGIKETTLEQDTEIMTTVISFSACDGDGQLLFESPEEAKGMFINDFNLLMDLGNKALEISGVKIGQAGMTSEVAVNLPKDQMTSLSENSHRNSRKRGKKS